MTIGNSGRSWVRRTSAGLVWVGRAADAAALVAGLCQSAHWGAAAKLVAAAAKAADWALHRWVSPRPRELPETDA